MKAKISIILASLLLTVSVANSYAATTIDRNKEAKERVAAMSEEEKKARLEALKTRAEEIRDMDKSTLTKSEKKALRKELKAMKKEAREVRGIYLSFGAVIIIILLLILIL